MARRGRRRSRMMWIPFTADLTLGALTDGTVIKQTIWTADEDFFIVGCKATWAMRDHTPTEGPVVVGLADNDLSVGEIVEAVDAAPATPRDRIAMERAGRPVRGVGVFDGLLSEEKLANGEKLRTPVKFTIFDDSTLAAWARNESGATLTTGSVINIRGHVYGRWRI